MIDRLNLKSDTSIRKEGTSRLFIQFQEITALPDGSCSLILINLFIEQITGAVPGLSNRGAQKIYESLVRLGHFVSAKNYAKFLTAGVLQGPGSSGVIKINALSSIWSVILKHSDL